MDWRVRTFGFCSPMRPCDLHNILTFFFALFAQSISTNLWLTRLVLWSNWTTHPSQPVSWASMTYCLFYAHQCHTKPTVRPVCYSSIVMLRGIVLHGRSESIPNLFIVWCVPINVHLCCIVTYCLQWLVLQMLWGSLSLRGMMFQFWCSTSKLTC